MPYTYVHQFDPVRLDFVANDGTRFTSIQDAETYCAEKNGH